MKVKRFNFRKCVRNIVVNVIDGILQIVSGNVSRIKKYELNGVFQKRSVTAGNYG